LRNCVKLSKKLASISSQKTAEDPAFVFARHSAPRNKAPLRNMKNSLMDRRPSVPPSELKFNYLKNGSRSLLREIAKKAATKLAKG
jgi:hypothetical protein